MNLSSIVPWGRSLDEYRDMFALSESDLKGRILGCGDGPASFNAEATRSGARIVSVDPIYEFSSEDIEARVLETFDLVMSQTRNETAAYFWKRWADPDALGVARLTAMRLFLADYETGKREGRYVPASLPDLPLPASSFDLALCSHLLFLYSEHLSLRDHLTAARELLRVATEVRIFPLFTLSDARSPYIADFCAALRSDGYTVEERKVGYEFRRGGNTMLRLRRTASRLGKIV